ncbi:terminase small subunit [Paenibacillus sp. Soil724D2]|uniref:terminase small subunit n=1 Tax=Paenibacillus sp. (strain Soil724D2) TaxID=1736392 RepID=UPI0007125903|nr:terminase small subunit [Paenibacillus sp. Soil724D2]KRE33285.1 hypothetical protein ASG85_13470 [Paenibacillus sp. Soil724D2]
MSLTVKQAMFVKEYLVDFNAGAAAVRAGYSEKTAYEMGYENLRKPQISEAIAEAQNKRIERVEWTADEILRDLKEIAQSVNEQTKDRLKAYELGGKAIAMFTDKVEQSGVVGVNIINDIPKRTT